jgi:hypothetical protein
MTIQSHTRQNGCRVISTRRTTAIASKRKVAFARRLSGAFFIAFFALVFSVLAPFSSVLADGYRGHGDKALWIAVSTFEVYEAPFLSYFNANGQELKVKVADIGGLKMADYPNLEKAELAKKAKNNKDALVAFQRARRKAKPAWLKLWLDAQLVPLLNAEGKGQDAANAYLALIESKAPVKFLDQPPVDSVGQMSKDAKKSLQTRLAKVLATTKERSNLWFSLKDLIDAADPAVEPVKPVPGVKPNGPKGTLASVIPIPNFMLSGDIDAITRQLARGSYDAALERVTGEIKATKGAGGRTSLRLFQLAMAQYNIAKPLVKSGSEEGKKKMLEANLNFMRVIIYFPNSPYAGPARMEAAEIQISIGRKDIAGKLLEKAQSTLDPDDTLMAKHLEALAAKLN